MQFRHFALTEDWGIAANVGAAYGAWTAQTWVMGDDGRIVTASPFAFFRPFRADLSIKKSSIFFPPFIAATSHRGLAPRPAQVSPDGPRYFGGTFLPFNPLPPPPTTLAPPATAILSNCF